MQNLRQFLKSYPTAGQRCKASSFKGNAITDQRDECEMFTNGSSGTSVPGVNIVWKERILRYA